MGRAMEMGCPMCVAPRVLHWSAIWLTSILDRLSFITKVMVETLKPLGTMLIKDPSLVAMPAWPVPASSMSSRMTGSTSRETRSVFILVA